MSVALLLRLLSVVLVTHVSITWVPFSSDAYPYTIRQPSSFRYAPLVNVFHQKVDYFTPSLGSATTYVSVLAVPGTTLPNPVTFLRNQAGFRVHRSGAVSIMRRQRVLTCANFSSFGSRWTEEQVSFVASGYVWRLTASYDPKFKSLRPLMLKMLSGFKLRPTSRTKSQVRHRHHA